MSFYQLTILAASIGLVSGCAQNQVQAPVPELSSDYSSRVYSVNGVDRYPLADIYALDGDVVYLLDGLEGDGGVDVSDEVVLVDVLKVGRYQLVQTSPVYIQANLLAQPVTVSVIVAKPLANIGYALFSAVESTGYTLCNTPEVSESLYKMPLPSVHYKMGPMPLINAIQVIVGPGWQVLTDQTNRSICFAPFIFEAQPRKLVSGAGLKPLSVKPIASEIKPTSMVVPVEPAANAAFGGSRGFNDL